MELELNKYKSSLRRVEVPIRLEFEDGTVVDDTLTVKYRPITEETLEAWEKLGEANGNGSAEVKWRLSEHLAKLVADVGMRQEGRVVEPTAEVLHGLDFKLLNDINEAIRDATFPSKKS